MSLDLPAPPSTIHTVVILGAGGYVGRSLCNFFHEIPSYQVLAVFRGTPTHQFYSRCIVTDVFADDWSTQVVSSEPLILINCAFDFMGVGKGDLESKYAVFERNLAALRRHGQPRFINVSTMSAFAGCRTDYGREKLSVEKLFG